jgi:hypothetical protein
MAISLLKNATGASATGGTALSLTSDGVEVKNGIHVSDPDETNFLLKTNMTLKNRNPQKQADGSYSKAKRYATIVVPKIIASGEVVYNLVRIEVEAHHETTSAELTNLHLLGSQVFFDADLQPFLNSGSLEL